MSSARRAFGLLAVAAGLFAVPVLAKKTDFRSAIYSSFFIHAETGDALGMELELHLGAQPFGVFTLCEGECGPIVRMPVRIADGLLHFTYAEPLVDEHGKPLPPAMLRFTATRRGNGLSVRQDGTDAAPDHLKPIARRRALAIPGHRPPVSYGGSGAR